MKATANERHQSVVTRKQMRTAAAPLPIRNGIALHLVGFALLLPLLSGCDVFFSAHRDYTIRSQVAEGLALAQAPRVALVEYVEAEQKYPMSNEEAGLPPAPEISGSYVNSISIDNGVVIITYGNQAHEQLAGHELFIFLDEEALPEYAWLCGSETIPNEWLPAACRQ